MSFCCFDKSSILVLIVCLIMIIGLAYLFNVRLSNVEKAVVKQNQILSDFITNVKNDMICSARLNPAQADSGASLEAIDVARTLCGSIKLTEKIGVSDSEDTSSDESDDISSSDSVEPVINKDVKQIQSIVIEKMQPEMFDCGIVMLHMSDLAQPLMQMSQPHIVELNDDSPGTASIMLSDLENTEQLDALSTSSSLSSHNDKPKIEIIDFKKMKINQLKEIAMSRGVDTKGKKKNELVETLSNI